MPTPVTRLSSVRLASSLFQSSFSSRPTVAASAPGRVNLIGEHTDYNDGYVMPFALAHRVMIAAAPRHGGTWSVTSLNNDSSRIFEVADLQPGMTGWPAYVAGIVWALRQAGHLWGGGAGDGPQAVDTRGPPPILREMSEPEFSDMLHELDALEAEGRDPIPHAYRLEVSSPGVERPLRRPEEFARRVGEKGKIRTLEPIEGARNHSGVLTAADEDGVTIDTEQGERRLHFGDISSARTVFDWKERGGKR